MGANYETIASLTLHPTDWVKVVRGFLDTRGCSLNATVDLDLANIVDDNAILVGPGGGRWAAWVAICSALDCDLATWFDNNPLAAYLSKRAASAIHLWSLNAAEVAGYAAYASGNKVECRCAFAGQACGNLELMKGVAAPTEMRGNELARLLEADYEFSRDVSEFKSLEIGLADLMSRFGFSVHLIDFYDSIDDKKGVAILGKTYEPIALRGWTAFLFDRAGGMKMG